MAQRIRVLDETLRTTEEAEWCVVDELLNPALGAVRGRSKSKNDMKALLRGELEGFEPPFPLEPELAQQIDDAKDEEHRQGELKKQAERRKQWSKRTAAQQKRARAAGRGAMSATTNMLAAAGKGGGGGGGDNGDDDDGDDDEATLAKQGKDWDLSHLDRNDVLRIWAEPNTCGCGRTKRR